MKCIYNTNKLFFKNITIKTIFMVKKKKQTDSFGWLLCALGHGIVSRKLLLNIETERSLIDFLSCFDAFSLFHRVSLSI